MKRLVPLGSDVILHPIERTKKIGSIYIPNPERTKVNQGIVVAMGPKVKEDLGLGDHVLFNGYSGDQVTLVESGKFYVIPDSHIVAKMEDTKVRIITTEAVKELVRARIGELRSQDTHFIGAKLMARDIESDLLERLETLPIAEGFIF